MTCIDCGQLRPVMLHQSWGTREWDVCVPCARRFRDEVRARANEPAPIATKKGKR